VAALRDRLVADGVRLLTLTGPAGTGKTRLALAVAAATGAAFPDGRWLVDLTPVGAASGVLPAAVRALGLQVGGEPSAEESLRRSLREKRLLLVLDNLEHVLGAAPAVAALLDACPGVAVLATSREPLRVRWERLYPVPPLALPAAPAAAMESPAVELFVQRARDVRPDFRLDAENAAAVAEVCRRLDGLPLAIELAAARSRALPPQAIRDRLEHRLDLLVGGRRDEPARHQTARAALAWSHDLLSPAEQVLFRRLAAFVSGCTPDAAAAVCDPAGDLPLDVLDGLESLLAKSLLRQEEVAGEPRFGMLETVREYALEALEGSGELDATRRRHAACYAELAGAAEPGLRGPAQLDWLSRLDREHGNLRAALLWLTQQGAGGDGAAAAGGLQMGADLWWYWHVRGAYAEARAVLEPLLALPAAGAQDADDPAAPARARAASALAVMSWGLGDYDTAAAQQGAALARLRALDDRPALAQSLIDIACVAISQGDGARAAPALVEALALARALDDGWKVAWALTFQGMLALAQGDPSAAGDRFEESLTIRRDLGDVFGAAWSYFGLASVARLRGDGVAARTRYETCLVTFRALGERPTVASVLDGLGEVAIARGDFAEARERFAESLALYREMGSTRGVGIALSGFAALAAAGWRAERAVRLAGAAAALHEAGGSAIELIRHRGSEDWLAEARRALGETRAAAVWADGRALSQDAAIDYALTPDSASSPAPRGPRGGRAHPRSTPDGDPGPLTARECEVARLVARGSSNRQIAAALVISERTAEAHLSNILSKLGLSTRVQLAAWAVGQRIATPED
jgi:predicted ATPase/DNA-binding CsgD family transcriptional regulator/Tfp pilus assembly protein PilF